MRKLLKSVVHAFSVTLVFPMALISGFGRLESIYVLGAQCCALFPGLPGDYLRIAYAWLTLDECGLESRIQFGSFFSHPQARVGQGVYIGSYCILGRTSIGDRTQIASHVQVLSGSRQHGRDEAGRIMGSNQDRFETVAIGPDCWIGAGSIVMAEIGAGTTIGAGAIVTRPIPAGSTAVGNPARVLSKTTAEQPVGHEGRS